MWLVASEHIYNVTNRGLGIGSDGLCELSTQRPDKRQKHSRTREQSSSAISR